MTYFQRLYKAEIFYNNQKGRYFYLLLFTFSFLFWTSFAQPVYSSGNFIWEVTSFDSGVFFSGANCSVSTSDFCPQEMGWEGNTVFYIFDIGANQNLSAKLKFEFHVTGLNYQGTENVRLEISCGSNLNNLSVIESDLEINQIGSFSVLFDANLLQNGVTNFIKVYGKNISPIGYGYNPPNFKINYVALINPIDWPVTITDQDLLDKTQAQSAKYFFEKALSNGLVKDTDTTSYASIAATGFGLSAFVVMANRYNTSPYWTYTPSELRNRSELILDTLIQIQQKQAQNENTYGKEGAFYHYIESDGTAKQGYNDVSTVDTALAMAGIIANAEYFGGTIKVKAETILSNINWAYFLNTPSNSFTVCSDCKDYQFTMGWRPTEGRLQQTWNRPSDETILVSLIAIASDLSNAEFHRSFYSWPRVKRTYSNQEVVNSYFGSLFTYEYAHAWVNFKSIGRDCPNKAVKGVDPVDWWKNSIAAVKAARQFSIDNSSSYPSYGQNSWGFSAVCKPNGIYVGDYGSLPTDSGLAYHDGTIAVYSSISSMPFFMDEDGGNLQDNLGFKALRYFYDTFNTTLWDYYGPKDSFDESGQICNKYIGIDQGIIVLMIENYRSQLIWDNFMKHTEIKSAINKLFRKPNIGILYLLLD
jgi:hypothetical protein